VVYFALGRRPENARIYLGRGSADQKADLSKKVPFLCGFFAGCAHIQSFIMFFVRYTALCIMTFLIVYFRQSSLYTLDLLYDLHLAPRNHQECGLIEILDLN